MVVNVNSLTLQVRMGFQAEILFPVIYELEEKVLVRGPHAFSDQPHPNQHL